MRNPAQGRWLTTKFINNETISRKGHKMTANEYQQLALKTEKTPEYLVIKEVDGISSFQLCQLLHAASGACTETGEFMDLLKKYIMYKKPFTRDKVIDEVGDSLWYISLALHAVGCSLEEAMEKNIAKLKVRFGDKFTSEKAINRDLAAEEAAIKGQ